MIIMHSLGFSSQVFSVSLFFFCNVEKKNMFHLDTKSSDETQ